MLRTVVSNKSLNLLGKTLKILFVTNNLMKCKKCTIKISAFGRFRTISSLRYSLLLISYNIVISSKIVDSGSEPILCKDKAN